MDWQDSFIDDMDGTVTLDVAEDGEYVIIGVTTDAGDNAGIALSAEAAQKLAYALNVLAAGL